MIEHIFNTSDGLASFLLERMAAEKARLVKEKKIDKPKALLLIPSLFENHIVAKVEELMALCDQLKTRVQAAQALQ